MKNLIKMTLVTLIEFGFVRYFRGVLQMGAGDPRLGVEIPGFVPAAFTGTGLMDAVDPGFEFFFTDFRSLRHGGVSCVAVIEFARNLSEDSDGN